jgi:hypothetical protein
LRFSNLSLAYLFLNTPTQAFAADNGINEAVLQLANLQTGVYLVRISNATATAEPMRIVKE